LIIFCVQDLHRLKIALYLFKEILKFTNPKKFFVMNKAQLIDAIAANAGLTKADGKKALDAFIKATTQALKKGDRVALVGFGSFSVSKRSARTGRNPQTGKEIKIPAKKVVKFKAGSDLANVVK
jgi:DNA-binding protein HU-beta